MFMAPYSEYSTKKISRHLIEEIKKVLEGKAWGSVEVYVQDYEVVQITERNIKKTKSDSSGSKQNSKF